MPMHTQLPASVLSFQYVSSQQMSRSWLQTAWSCQIVVVNLPRIGLLLHVSNTEGNIAVLIVS